MIWIQLYLGNAKIAWSDLEILKHILIISCFLFYKWASLKQTWCHVTILTNLFALVISFLISLIKNPSKPSSSSPRWAKPDEKNCKEKTYKQTKRFVLITIIIILKHKKPVYFFVRGAHKQKEHPQREGREDIQGDFVEPHKIFPFPPIWTLYLPWCSAGE